MLILTVKEPWGTAIFRLRKKIENRTWQTNDPSLTQDGRIYIHTSQRINQKDIQALMEILNFTGQKMPQNLITGAIIGYVELTDIVTNSTSIWALPNQYHWLLTNPILFKTPIYCKGKLGLWNPDSELKILIEKAQLS